jgi:hypothetical protein
MCCGHRSHPSTLLIVVLQVHTPANSPPETNQIDDSSVLGSLFRRAVRETICPPSIRSAAAFSSYITGYTARIDRTKAGFPITAFVAVRYPDAEMASAERAVKALETNPSVLEAHHVAGEDCYIIKVAAPSLEALERILRSLKEPGLVAGTRTTIVLSSVFEKPGVVPVELD